LTGEACDRHFVENVEDALRVECVQLKLQRARVGGLQRTIGGRALRLSAGGPELGPAQEPTMGEFQDLATFGVSPRA
jgi:hypothetical protein